jgi:hypothetical protein
VSLADLELHESSIEEKRFFEITEQMLALPAVHRDDMLPTDRAPAIARAPPSGNDQIQMARLAQTQRAPM